MSHDGNQRTSCNGRTNAVRDGSETILGRALARRHAGIRGASCDSSRAICRDKHVKRVYIAGGSTERIDVGQKWIQRAREAGIEVAYDWTACDSYDPDWLLGWLDKNVHQAWQGVAKRDFDAVLSADIVWILVPQQLSEGAATELGIALAARALAGHRMILVASGKSVHRNLFNRLTNAQFDAHEAAFEYVRGLCGLRDGESKESPQYTFAP
jgi:hypothetical protein